MARTEGNRPEPRQRATAKPPPKRQNLPTVDDAQESSGLGRKVLFGGIGLVVLAGLVALSVGLANQEDIVDTLPTDVAVEVSGDALPRLDPTTADPALGQAAPEITSIDFDGNAASISNDGVPKLILFLAHWCPHCQREVPALQSWIDANGLPDGVEFVSVATANDRARANYPPNAWLAREGWTQRVLLDDDRNSIGNAFGLPAFPYYVLVDGDGNVLGRITGEQTTDTVALFLESLAQTASG